MALAHCILGKFLGVGCHFFPPIYIYIYIYDISSLRVKMFPYTTLMLSGLLPSGKEEEKFLYRPGQALRVPGC